MKNDDDYWNEKATILNYQEKLLKKEVTSSDHSCISNETLADEAINTTGKINFQDLLNQYGFEDSFHELSSDKILISVGIGILGTFTALLTDSRGNFIEGKVQKLETIKMNPSDYKAGHAHRSYFGHDFLNPAQKLPKGFQYKGEDIGGVSLFNLYLRKYGESNNLIINSLRPIRFIWDFFIHLLSDLPTPDGLPIPGSSYFTKWENNILNTSGFTSRNNFLSSLGNEFDSINLSDITSTAVIALLSSQYIKQITKKKIFGENAKKILENQIKITAYGSGLISQLGLFILGIKTPSAKLNYPMLLTFIKASYSLCRLLNIEDKAIIDNYQKSIDILKDDNNSFEDYQEAQ